MENNPSRKTILFFYSATGNSLWAARVLSRHLGEAEVLPMLTPPGNDTLWQADAIGFIFPVHIWGLPRQVIEFIEQTINDPDKYYFAVATHGGQVAGTLLELRDLLLRRDVRLSAGYDLSMISNYIPWGGPGTTDHIRRKIRVAEEKLQQIAVAVGQRGTGPIEKGPFWQNIPFSWMHHLSFHHVSVMDKGFWTDSRCNGCNICRAICPHDNIKIVDNRPVWRHQCRQCLACIQWCPQQSIQYGKKTVHRERYHHPEIRLNDLLAVTQKNQGKE